MEDYYEYLDSNGVTTLYKLIKDDTVALIDSYSVTINGITTTLDTHINDRDIHTPIADIENMVDTKISGLVNSAPETLDTLKELADALGNDPNFATTVANQIGNKASKDSVYTKEETDTLLEGKANSVHSHVVEDITDFPTIPTKLSQLENDMGFGSGSGGAITSISWTNITDKPNFATVATSGSYNDLSNKPTIPKVYNKTLTIQKNGTNVATFTSNSNTDVTADITVPTKVSELSNDSGFITGISWDKVTNKPTLATVATSGSYTDLSNTPTIPTKVSQLENDTGFVSGLTDVVDTKSNQTINGTKTFTSILKVSHGTLQVGSDAGYSVTYSWSGNIVSKQPSGTFNISLPKANGTLAIDENIVHISGNETITGFKSFTEVLDRRNDITASTVATATQLVDTNANRCGWIANRMHWSGNYHVHNRHIAYNENSGKEVYIDIISSNNGSGGLFVGGSAINRNLYDVTSATDSTVLATMGWVNNPATSTNVVHRSGDETIGGNKTFSNKIKGNLQGNADTSTKSSCLDNYSVPGMNQIYLDWDHQVKGYVGLKVDNTVMGGLITTKNIGSQAANSATYSTTPATTDNSTRIATTAWVRTYVNSVAGSNTVGSSVSAYWSNSSLVTATGQASAHSSSSSVYPACYSDYVNKTPTVGTIYSGAQLYTEYGTSASATGTLQSQGQYVTRITTTTAQVTFRSPISTTGKYLCTTANTVKFRAYTTQGSTSTVGASSIVDYTITKSIFIRVE